MSALRQEQYYTYQDWLDLELGECEMAELIDGRIYMMASPSRRHQAISRNMSTQLSNYLSGKKCKIYFSPFAVRLEKDTVVLPDIVVICDPKKLTPSGCSGTPDLVIEILSPSTSSYDKVKKFKLYKESGVPEYWIVDPSDNLVSAYRLADNGYLATVYDDTNTATVTALPGFEMDLAAVFAEE